MEIVLVLVLPLVIGFSKAENDDESEDDLVFSSSSGAARRHG
jgi:hypothetical protein